MNDNDSRASFALSRVGRRIPSSSPSPLDEIYISFFSWQSAALRAIIHQGITRHDFLKRQNSRTTGKETKATIMWKPSTEQFAHSTSLKGRFGNNDPTHIPPKLNATIA